MNLRRLRHLVLLYEELNFARAADRAALSQSAFSRSIQTLEDEVGLRLFDRSPRAVRPTAAGVRLVVRARRLLSSADDMDRELAHLKSGDLGSVAVGAGPFSSGALLPPALSRLHQQHPSVQVRVVIDNWSRQLRNLFEESIDFFVGDTREIPASDDLVVEPLGTLYGAFFCRHDHPLAVAKSVSLADLAPYCIASVLLPEEVAHLLRRVLDLPTEVVLPMAFECESPHFSRDVVLQTDALLLATRVALRYDIAAGLLHELNVPELQQLGPRTPLQSPIGIVRLVDRTLTPAAELLIGLIQEVAEHELHSDELAQ